MPNNHSTEPPEPPKWAVRVMVTVYIMFLLFVLGVLVFLSYVFMTVIGGDDTFLYQVSVYPLEMEVAMTVAKVYLGFTMAILLLYSFQLFTFFISFKFQIPICFIYPFLGSIVINLILSVVFFFLAGLPVKVIPVVTFFITLGMASATGEIGSK